ncbi:MAG: DNA-3-methyladenine glycosylase family protein [Acholeplasmataceae bacterium]
MNPYIYTSLSPEVRHITSKDRAFIPLVERIERIVVPIESDHFKFLSHTILSQQLSSRVAEILIDRFMTLMKGDVRPEAILRARHEDLKGIGLSSSKIDYLRSLSEAVTTESLDLRGLGLLPDEQVIQKLVEIRGIGRWTAEMFLMFALGREDVFSVRDLGLRNAVKRIYRNDRLSEQEIEDISRKWKPYRSVAAHYLWHVWDFE